MFIKVDPISLVGQISSTTKSVGRIAAFVRRGQTDASGQSGPARVCDHPYRLARRMARLHIAIALRRARAFRLQCRDAGAAGRDDRAGAGAQSSGMALSVRIRGRLHLLLPAGFSGGLHRTGTRRCQQHHARNGGGHDQYRVRGAADPSLDLRPASLPCCPRPSQPCSLRR